MRGSFVDTRDSGLIDTQYTHGFIHNRISGLCKTCI